MSVRSRRRLFLLLPLLCLILTLFFIGAAEVFSRLLAYSSIAAANERANIELADSPLSPQRLLIPSLSVDAEVLHVGFSANWNMMAPKGFKTVGWLTSGPLPGDRGNAVFAGHLDNGLGFPAVFVNLSKLKKGDTIYVKDKDDKALRFAVKRSVIYEADDPVLASIIAEKGIGIALITCSGAWMPAMNDYSHRLVVFAERL